MISEKAFTCLSVMAEADFFSIIPDREKFMFSRFSIKDIH